MKCNNIKVVVGRLLRFKFQSIGNILRERHCKGVNIKRRRHSQHLTVVDKANFDVVDFLQFGRSIDKAAEKRLFVSR